MKIFKDEFLKKIDIEHKKHRKEYANYLKQLEEIRPNIERTHGKSPLNDNAISSLEEAEKAFVYGLERSCIINCAFIIESIFKTEYLKYSKIINNCSTIRKGKPEKGKESATFGNIIKWCKDEKIESLKSFIYDASIMNEMRNNVVAHPFYIPNFKKKEDLQEICVAIRTDNENIKKILGKIDKKLLERYKNVQTPAKMPNGSSDLISEDKIFKSNQDDFLLLIHWDMQLNFAISMFSVESIKITKKKIRRYIFAKLITIGKRKN